MGCGVHVLQRRFVIQQTVNRHCRTPRPVQPVAQHMTSGSLEENSGQHPSTRSQACYDSGDKAMTAVGIWGLHVTTCHLSSQTERPARLCGRRLGRTDGGHGGDDEAAAAAGLRVHRAQLRVLPDHARVLLVQAHRLLDLKRLACTSASLPPVLLTQPSTCMQASG